MSKGPTPKPIGERFWPKVEKSAGCWIWTGGTQRGGYGHFNKRPDDPVTSRRAHKVAYELMVGAVPDGLVLRHTCDNPLCVNPAHLVPGTHADNMADMIKRGRQHKATPLEECARGHRDYRTKPDGRRYCHPCNLLSCQRRRAAKLG